MKMNLLILENEEYTRNELAPLLHFHCSLYLNQIDVISTVEEARIQLSICNYSIFILDINLHTISGLDFISIISESTKVIFISADSECALFAIKNHAFDFFLRPLNFDELKLSIQNCSLHFKQFHKQYLQIKSNGITIPFQLSNINFIKARGPYSEINLINGKVYITSQTLKKLNSQLNDIFIRVHKSYIVNRDNIIGYNQKELYLDKIVIPLSRVGLVHLQQLFSR